jgi:uncharacterized protein YjbJ (UPF0337 family)
MSGLTDRISGRIKKAAGDLVDDPGLRNQGVQEERKADAKEELAQAKRTADEKAEEIARLERDNARSRAHRQGSSAGHGADVSAEGFSDTDGSATGHTGR